MSPRTSRAAGVAAAVALALAAAGCSKPDDGAAGRPIAPPGAQAVGGQIPSTQQILPDGGDFTLTGVDGKPFALASLRGRPVVLFFGYASCPDFCPRAMGTVRAALAKLDPAARAKVATVFVSVDPERDTPKVLASYLKQFDVGAFGATGTHDQLTRSSSATAANTSATRRRRRRPTPSATRRRSTWSARQAGCGRLSRALTK